MLRFPVFNASSRGLIHHSMASPTTCLSTDVGIASTSTESPRKLLLRESVVFVGLVGNDNSTILASVTASRSKLISTVAVRVSIRRPALGSRRAAHTRRLLRRDGTCDAGQSCRTSVRSACS